MWRAKSLVRKHASPNILITLLLSEADMLFGCKSVNIGIERGKARI
jgi:hypothetical protein